MALSTSTSTLTVGASRTFNLSPGSALTLVALPNVRATVTETPNTVSASGVGGNASRVHNLQLGQTVTYGPYAMGGTVVVANAINSGTAITWVRSDSIVAESASGSVSLVSGDGAELVDLDTLRQSDGYHFHGFAPNQINSDLKFYDYSGALNDGTFQAQLTAANAWANAGFLTQADPSGVGNLMLTALPALGFDYLAGDSLLIFWRGMATPEGGTSPIMGNTAGTAANGIRVVVTTAGKLQVNAYQASGALSRFGGTSTGTCFEAAVAHSFAFAINGVAGTHCYWVDGARDAAYASGFLTFGSGGIIDTATSTTLKLGGDGATSGSVQLGVACRTQALAVLQGRRGLGTPAVADLDLLVANLHRNPQTLVLASAW